LMESENLTEWREVSAWFRATNSLTIINMPLVNPRKYYLIEVKP
jgi:hypothetical protein